MNPFNNPSQIPQNGYSAGGAHPYDNSPSRIQARPPNQFLQGSASRMPANSQFIQQSPSSFKIPTQNYQPTANFQTQNGKIGGQRQWQNYDIKPPVSDPNLNNYDKILQEYNRKQDDNERDQRVRNQMIEQMEKTLEQERQKSHQMRLAMQQDNEKEKRLNQEFESKIKSLREESYRKDEVMTEMQKQIAALKDENFRLDEHNKQQASKTYSINEELSYIKRVSEEEKIHLNRNLQNQDDRYRQEVDRLNRENEQSIDSLNKQWDFKYKALEEKCKNLLQVKSGIEQELRAMDQEIVRERMEHEERLRQKTVQVQQDEQKKYQSSLRAVEQKLNASEQSFQNMVQKNKELILELSDREKTLREQSIVLEQLQNNQKQEVAEFQNQINHLTLYREQQTQEMNNLENQYRKTDVEYLELKRNIQAIRDEHQNEIIAVEEQNRVEKTKLEAIRDKQARKLGEQEKTMQQMEEEIEKLRKDQEKLKEMLQDKIKNTINTTVQDSSKYLNNPEFTGGRPQHTLKY